MVVVFPDHNFSIDSGSSYCEYLLMPNATFSEIVITAVQNQAHRYLERGPGRQQACALPTYWVLENECLVPYTTYK